jgi:hypothetical protein
MNTLMAMQTEQRADSLRRTVDQLRDPLAIGFAAGTAALAYRFAQPPEIAILVGVAVLFVRVAAGLLIPVPGRLLIPPLSLLTEDEIVIATHVGNRVDDQEIATRRGITRKAVARMVERIKRTLGYETRHEIEIWAGWVGIIDPPPPPPKPIYDRWVIKMMLMTASFIGLGSTLYTLAERFWPDLFPR